VGDRTYENAPEIHSDKEGEVQEPVEREQQDENVVGERLCKAVAEVESM
jgi:hypothetical protein